jgi:hypothetical protein
LADDRGGTQEMKLALAFAALLAFSGCAAPPAPSGVTRSPSPTTASPSPVVPVDIALPVQTPLDVPLGVPLACRGIGINAILRGDATDPRVAWLVSNLGTRLDVEWPAGYKARFSPKLEVLDASGTVVLREGDPVIGGCVTRQPGVLLLQPPFR